MIEEIKKRHQHEKEKGSYIDEQQCFDFREWLIKEIERLQEREFNHYPMEILELETRIFKLQEDLEAAHDALEMLPPKEVEINERTQFKIDKRVDRILIESLKKEKALLGTECNYWNNQHSKETERADKLKVIAEDRSKLIEELISENMRFKEALEHICEVEMDNAEFEKELMFNIARDALKI